MVAYQLPVICLSVACDLPVEFEKFSVYLRTDVHNTLGVFNRDVLSVIC
jgi:hypothetical protein